ncbi:ubiquitin-conjugating enzyme E2 T [Pseudorca crassidens]|uniref:ubiquitin-conjugating enzyme E2 T n=1 Tax=Pseudorca crassidens TaxID=82174 RepID=UPI00352E6866
MTVLERQPLRVKDLDRSPFSRSDSPGSSYHAHRSDRRSQSRASSRAPRPCSKRVGVARSEPSQSESALLPGGAPDQSHPRGREAGRRNCRARAGVVQAGRRLCTARGVSAGIPASVECGAGNRVWVILPGVMQRASRLKRELSLLAAEPPPGITCWQDGDRMEDLRAQILGGADTPYEKGVFKLEVNIPERYPFEPPQIRFLTPIYHPNIDSAGRICLDVLKLPPKGAWRPSLNIATLLTSVQQLMAEPNPDDPLMADISSEFKYNKPVFLRNARQWTEKHARQKADEEETPDNRPEAGDSEGHSEAQKRKARPLGGVEKKFCPDV